jgi:hypothetical protein
MVECFKQPIVKHDMRGVEEYESGLLRATLGRRTCLVNETSGTRIWLLSIDPIEQFHHLARGWRLASNPCFAARTTYLALSLTLAPLPIGPLRLPRLLLENCLAKVREIWYRPDDPMRASSTVRAPKGQRDPLELHPSGCSMRRMGAANRAHVNRQSGLRLQKPLATKRRPLDDGVGTVPPKRLDDLAIALTNADGVAQLLFEHTEGLARPRRAHPPGN